MSASLSRRRKPLCRLRWAAYAGLFALSTSPAAAQATAAVAPPPAETAPSEVRAPYEPQLLRLARIVGALAYLRNLCGDDDAAKWRTEMADLIASEQAVSAGERNRLAGAYNEAFRGYALTYRVCTPNAELVIERDLKEGARLTHAIVSRYGRG